MMNIATDIQFSLTQIISDKILENGPVSFCDFMQMALYYPERGYYTSGKKRIGTKGDYYTSPDVTSLLGVMIARQLEEMWNLVGRKAFTIIEYGAGSGALCMDILTQLKSNIEFYECLTYYIVEKGEINREREKTLLPEKVYPINTIHEIAPVTGCILSNELIDNFPVHRVVMKDELMEIFVGYDDGFYEFLQPPTTPLNEYFSELGITLPRGFCTEVNTGAIDWIREIAGNLHKGFVITIDYGYSSPELYGMDKRLGTLLCYSKHTINDNLYNNIGNQDITAHVNFSALHHWGSKYGLDYGGFTNQVHFLHALGLNNYLRKLEESNHDDMNKEQLAFFINTFITGLGSKLKVLIQHKGMNPPKLSGMKIALNNL